MAGPALGLELGLRRLPRDVPVMGRLALLVAREATRLVEAQVRATLSQQLGAGLHRRLPVEDDGVLGGTDDHGVPREGARLEEGRLDSESTQPVGEVADGLVVAEVGLADPARRTLAHDAVEHAVRGVLPDDGEAGVVDGPGAQDHPGRDDVLEEPAGLGDLTGEGEHQLLEPGPGHGGDNEDLQAAGLEVVLHELGEVEGLGDVGLVEDDDAGALGERTATEVGVGDVERELLLDDVEVAHRVSPRLERRAVDDVDEHRAPLDVAQELQAQALALVRAGDQPGHVGDRVSGVARADDAEVGHERRERVVGDLGSGCREHRDERGLARGREPDQGDVGERLQLEDDVQRLAGLPEQGEAGSLAARRGEGLVAEPATAAAGDDVLGAMADEVDEDPAAAVLDDRALGHGQHEVAAVGAVALVAGAGLAVGRVTVGVVVVVQQRRRLRVDAHDDRPTATAVAAVRAAERFELLALDRCHTVATGTGRDLEKHPVDEVRRHDRLLLGRQERPVCRGTGAPGIPGAGVVRDRSGAARQEGASPAARPLPMSAAVRLRRRPCRPDAPRPARC